MIEYKICLIIRGPYVLFRNILQKFIILKFDVHLDHSFAILVFLSDKLSVWAVDMKSKYVILGFLFIYKAKEIVRIEAYFIAYFPITK